MAYAGQVIENSVSGEKITFRRTSADTNGELLEFDIELTPDGQVPGMHVHPAQEERFEVLGGTGRFRKGLRRITAPAGDVVVVEPGAPTSSRTSAATPPRCASRSPPRSRWSVCSRPPCRWLRS